MNVNSVIGEPYSDRRLWFGLTGFVLGIILAACLITGGIVALTRYASQRECAGYASKTERPTRFVSYVWWSWDCLTPSPDGRWIPTDQLRQPVTEA